jgi:hypothetical protein
VVLAPLLFRDGSLQLVLVRSRLEPPQVGDACLDAFARRLVLQCLLAVPVRDFGDEPVADRLVDLQEFERAPRFLFEDALGVVPLAAARAFAGVVRVPSLFQVPGERAVARAAAEQSAVGELVALLSWSSPSADGVLDLDEDVVIDERFVRAFVRLAAPREGAGVRVVLEEPCDLALGYGVAVARA